MNVEVAISARRAAFELDVAFASDGVSAIMGPNGGGQPTLLRAVLGAVRPEHGRIAIAGRIVFDRETGIDVPVEERAIAYVPQGYGRFPHLTALENVLFGVRQEKDRRARAMQLLAELELEHVIHRRPSNCREVSSNAWRSPERSRQIPDCSCSTSRSRRST